MASGERSLLLAFVDLSDAVETRILEEEDADDGGVVADRLTARRRLILRVLAADDVEAAEKLSEFEARVRLVRLIRLVIDQALDVGGSKCTARSRSTEERSIAPK